MVSITKDNKSKNNKINNIINFNKELIIIILNKIIFKIIKIKLNFYIFIFNLIF